MVEVEVVLCDMFMVEVAAVVWSVEVVRSVDVLLDDVVVCVLRVCMLLMIVIRLKFVGCGGC